MSRSLLFLVGLGLSVFMVSRTSLFRYKIIYQNNIGSLEEPEYTPPKSEISNDLSVNDQVSYKPLQETNLDENTFEYSGLPSTKSTPSFIQTIPQKPEVRSSTYNYSSHSILGCGNNRVPANFRESPSLLPNTILGVVKVGDNVKPTGRQVNAYGVTWHQVVGSQLYPTPLQGAKNQLYPNQIGWIAECFLR